ncbi:hypothetical protein GGR51DRAFT_294203 [Nemania sp. FL0031]|nr:hypothetical protein GGR51DRAFT_294203 [Nemania sp. FL0031]
MASPTSSPHPVRLSPLEGFMPRAYVRQIYCFPASSPHVADVLLRGLSGLAQDVPYILSRVVRDTSSSDITISAPYHSPEDIFSWHDLSDSISYATLKARHFPPDAFLAPGITPPDSLPPYPAAPAVFLARASLVDGGLILCVAVHHAVTDITGFGALLKMWAAHCRDGSSQCIGFDANWMDRGPLFSTSASASSPSPENPMRMPDLLHIATPEELARSKARSQAAGKRSYQTAIFYFPQTRLWALKDRVNKHIASTDLRSWVSTSDILSSLLWSSIIEARERSAPAGGDKSVADEDTRVSVLSFPVQFRSALRPPLPQDFLGAAFLMTSARVPHRDVCLISNPQTNPESAVRDQTLRAGVETSGDFVDIPALARVALATRRSTQKIDDAAVREVLAYLEAHPEINPEAPLILGPPRYHEGGSGTSVVSWADQCAYELDWGDVVGRCDAVRLSKMGYERDPIVLPRVPSVNGDDGGLEVIMSYEEGFMQRLIESPTITQFAVLRCLS